MERGSYFSSFNHNRLIRLLERENFYKPRVGCGETVIRCMSFIQFCGVCAVSLVTVVTPWMLAGMELIMTMIIYFTVVPHSVENVSAAAGLTDNEKYSFKFGNSLEDILISSIVRVVLLSIAYGLGSGRCCHRPYYYTSIVTTSFMIPYVFIKAIVTLLRPLLPVLLLLIMSGIFSVVHVVVARATMKRATRRCNMGLIGFGYPWEEGEEAWVMAGRRSFHETGTDDDILLDLDVPREVMRDVDSKFIDCGGLSVHYKEEMPFYGECADKSFAVLLIHGFGGGVFSWRHLMRPLAELTCCRVIAFDRPAFGLTSRPEVCPGSPNPYTLMSQRRLVIQFCQALKIKKVVLIGHSDGCLLSLMVTAAVRRDAGGGMLSMVPSRAPSVSSMVEIGMSVRKTASDHQSGRSSFSESSQFMVDHGASVPLLSSPLSPPGIVMEPWIQSSLSVASVVFLHPDFSCEEGPGFTNLLMQSRIGRKFLRPLLRSDVGEVANRRAWYDTSKLTNEVVQLYKAPLRIHGWDSALCEYTKVRRQVNRQQIGELKRRVIGLPTMVVTGDKDRLVPQEVASNIAEDLKADHMSVLPECGHISHEEQPEMLLEVLVGFVEHMCDSMEE
ncbi:hypothetical protein BSKO_01363 [Bryopsis sp. KO-2023]|nr:hypothetical protein BSKO_01363 [Bryopsis sp. KO-2023]